MVSADNNRLKEICAIVPTLNPGDKFVEVIDLLTERGFGKILVIDDGSDDKYSDYFEKAKQYPNCIVIKHYRNLGKGRALKTAFNYYLNNFSEMTGAVTLDADNQHNIDDVVRCSEALLENPHSLILGVRDFKSLDVPRRNKMGNTITIWVFNVLCGIKVSDTQTGLRALSGSVMSIFLDLPGERFEYETNMLIETKRKFIPLKEVTIKTVYFKGENTSHFNPLTDSIRIYRLIFKFLSASLGSCFIDLSVFTIIMAVIAGAALEWKVTLATVVARVISSLFNYLVNRNFVFRSNNKIGETIAKYYTLALFQMLLSLGGVYLLTILLGINSTLIKAFVDFVLFFIGFQIQREWVFNKMRNRKSDVGL